MFLTDNIFDQNDANNGGGAYVEVCGSGVFQGNDFQSNKAQHSGGGLFLINCPGASADLLLVHVCWSACEEAKARDAGTGLGSPWCGCCACWIVQTR